MNENTNSPRRREWVKNVAIIFLSIMLVLTFFSNTIMNYSLPEVATEYVQSGTITEKVRGSGTLEATDPYNVVINESRKIESVNVQNGDFVEKDSVLFYLEDVESDELKTAQKELDDLRLAYLTGLFTGDISSDVITKVESGNTGTLATYQAQLADIDNRITAAKNSLSAATANQQNVQNNLNNLTGQKNIKDAVVVDTTGEKMAVNSASASVTNAEAEVSRIEAEMGAVDANIKAAADLLGIPITDDMGNIGLEGGVKKFQDAKSAAEAELEAEKLNIPTAEAGVAEAKVKLQEAEQKLADARLSGDEEQIKQAELELGEIDRFVYNAALEQLAKEQEDVKVAEDKVSVANGELEQAKQVLATYNANCSLKASLQSSLDNANNNLNNAKSTLTAAQTALSNKEASGNNVSEMNDLNTQIAQATNSKTEAETQVANLNAEITKLETEKSELLKSLTTEMNLSAQNAYISKKEAEIEALKAKSVGTTVTAPVSGTVTSITYVAGETTKPDEVIAVIQPEGKGFTLSFSVTSEQARKLTVGDIAELQEAWYYEGVKATLSSIKPDANEPAKKKLLTFDVEGDVQAGQSLNLSIGQKSMDYELVVPNSAIREDKNGKFVLVVESKSSPLGNRYIATRVDVEVLAKDDTYSAISGVLYGSEYVITTATKPVEAGKQVRLAD